MKKMTEDELQYIIIRLIDNANDAVADAKKNSGSAFAMGKRLAYYEMLNVIKNELIINDADLKKFGMNFNIDKLV